MNAKLIPSLLVCLILLGACIKQNPHAADKLRLGYMLNITHAVPMIGIEEKKFTGVQQQFFLTGTNMVDALITGNIDLAYFGPGPWINAVSKGIDLVLLKVVAYGANSLVLAKPLDEVRKVAVPQYGNTQDLVARILFKKLGMKVEYIAINTAEMEMAFFTKDIDAAVVPEPWGTVLKHKSGLSASSVVRGIDLNVYPAAMLIVERGFYQAHQAQVDKFIGEQDAVQDWIRANPDAAKILIKKHLEANTKKTLKDADINDSYAKVRFDSHIDEALMEEMRQAAIEARYLRNKPDLTKYYGS